MPVYTLHVYECDEEGCGATVTDTTQSEARSKAVAQGWLATGDDIRCREHRTYRKCANPSCARDMRPWGTRKALHPTTVAPGSGGYCSTCTERRNKGKPVYVRKQDAKMEAAVKRYISMSTEGFKALFYGDADEREELARKTAPQDLWPILGL